MEKMWRCAVCTNDSRSYSNGVQWEFAPVLHSERRVLAHLLQFHDIPPGDLKSARLAESDYSGGLTLGTRVLAHVDSLRPDWARYAPAWQLAQ